METVEIEELTKLFRQQTYYHLGTQSIEIMFNKKEGIFFDFKMGVTREHLSKLGQSSAIKILASIIPNIVYVQHNFSENIDRHGSHGYSIFFEEEPKMFKDFDKDLIFGTCKFVSIAKEMPKD